MPNKIPIKRLFERERESGGERDKIRQMKRGVRVGALWYGASIFMYE